MSTSAALVLAGFLDQRARAVRAIEAEAEGLIHGKGDQAGYVAKMREKAMLLADLSGDAQGLVLALDADLAEEVEERLERFSASAANSLRVGSPFYMSALLYPDDHRPGEPNDLERFAAEVRGRG